MLNVYEVLELEKKWQEYDRNRGKNNILFKNSKFKFFTILDKKFNIMLLFGFILFIVLAMVFYQLFFLSSTVSSAKQTKFTTFSKINQNKNKTDKLSAVSKLEQETVQAEKEKIKLKNQIKQINHADNSIDADDSIAVDSSYKITKGTLLMPQYIDIKDDYKGNQSVERKKSDIKPAKTVDVEDIEQAISENVSIETSDNSSIVTVSNASVDIDDLLNYFKKYPSANNAVKVSKTYFNLGDYINAKTWALKANSMDKDNEDSWLLFAKSNYKLGNKQDAIGVLNDYLKFNSSNKAKKILRLMQQGIL